MPAAFAHRVLREVASLTGDPPTLRQLAVRVGVEKEDQVDFEAAVDTLVSSERIILGQDGRHRLPATGNEITGTFRMARRGFGFVISEHPVREGDLYIPLGESGGALSGDTVRASVTGRRRRGKTNQPTGRIIEVLKRARTVFAGRLVKKRGRWMIEPDGRVLRDDVLVGDPHSRNAGEGAKVVFELTAWPEGDYVAEAVITEVLGQSGEPDVETKAVIAASEFPTEFSKEALEEARCSIKDFNPRQSVDASQREDLTDTFTFTIDPPDARDFDDAISIEHDKSKNTWTLGIHIADVAHFVTAGGPLDADAVSRGNSVYLPRHVIPMLPETLSNGVCSLQEGIERYTKSVFIQFDGKGQVLGQRVSRTLIRSRKRMTYLEAQSLIEGDAATAATHARTETPPSEELMEALQQAERLAKALQARRRREGMIVLDLPVAEQFFDDKGELVDIRPEDGAFTHVLIEMFMVEANEAVARLFDGIGIPIMRRIHPEPSFDDLAMVRNMVAGHGVKVPDNPTRKDLQRILDASRGTPAARSVHFAILRSLTKATYSPAAIGHFALASDQYVHFTSPIRRYPDLIVHRALDAWLDATDNGRTTGGGKKRRALQKRVAGDDRVLDEGALIVLGAQCSLTEERATAAERDLREYFSLRFLESRHLGDVLPGVICGFNKGGLFVSLDRYLVEGSVQWNAVDGESSRPDRWTEISGTGRVVAQRTGAVLSIGDPVTVQVVRVDPTGRVLDLVLVDRPLRHAKRSEDKKDRRNRQKRRR